jgi:hypothetical protein
MSSLSMHSVFQEAPAFGHQARSNSPSNSPKHANALKASSAKAVNSDDSTEKEREHVHMNPQRPMPESKSKRRRNVTSPLSMSSSRRARDTRRSMSTSGDVRYTDSDSSGRDLLSSPSEQSRDWLQRNRRTRRNIQRQSSPWTLQPIIRFEPHQLFIQPVKEHVVRRFRRWRARSRLNRESHARTSSEELPKHKTSRRHARRIPNNTEILDEETGPDLPTCYSAPVTFAQTRRPPLRRPPQYKPLTSPLYLSTATTDETNPYFPPIWQQNPYIPAQRTNRPSRLSQPHRNSSVVYNPPLFQEASPRSKRASRDEDASVPSSSSGSEVPRLKFL